MRTATRTWHLLPHDRDAIERLGRALQLSPVVAQLLLNRRLGDPDQARRFLDVPLTGLHPPEGLADVNEAADRIYRAARDGRRICVYGDYDVDGVSGTAILVQALRLLGAGVDHYVPHRLEEGYGLNPEALALIARGGASLVVTVDCGIASTFEAEEAKRLGLELIITDHHEPRDRLPDAAVLVHPRLPGRPHPFGGLCGAGVAFKLAWALCQRASGGGPKVAQHFKEFLLDSVMLVALATVADCVPLHDENRIFVRHGLARLGKAPSVGLKALLATAGLAEKAEVSANDVGFTLAPRLNAASRLGCASMVLQLLTTKSEQEAGTLADHLARQNEQRQTIERRMLAEAREQVADLDLDSTPALVLASPDWHAGVIGIVAGRMADQYARPALMIALTRRRDEAELVGQGSGRSVADFPLHEALKACGDLLLSHGGHRAAVGFKIHPDNLDLFRERFCAYAAQHFNGQLPAPSLELDAEVPLAAVTVGLVKDLGRLEPYGMDNRRPLFLASNLQVAPSPRRVGAGERHLSFSVKQGGTTLKCIAFGMADRLDELMSEGGRCCLAFTPKLNEWQGRVSVDLEVKDFQAGPQPQLAG